MKRAGVGKKRRRSSSSSDEMRGPASEEGR